MPIYTKPGKYVEHLKKKKKKSAKYMGQLVVRYNQIGAQDMS